MYTTSELGTFPECLPTHELTAMRPPISRLSQLSPSAAYMAFGDSDGAMHLLSAAEEVMLLFKGFESELMERLDTPEPLSEVDWTDMTPLNSVSMPFYNNLLLSSWSADFIPTPMYFPSPPKIPQQALSAIKIKTSRSATARWRLFIPNSASRILIWSLRSDTVQRIGDTYYQLVHEPACTGHALHDADTELAKSHITTDCPREHCLLCELGFVARGCRRDQLSI
ncbi:hypothetical protein C8Q74DRAFT_28947 [Fomes fomentarius]|nr:hypothetical protein C8Q74DRAFT_28947 [Fomes fomentarius]